MKQSLVVLSFAGIALLIIIFLRRPILDKFEVGPHDQPTPVGVVASSPLESTVSNEMHVKPAPLSTDETEYYLTVYHAYKAKYLAYLLGAGLSADGAEQALHNHVQKSLAVRGFVEVVDNDKPMPLAAVHEVQIQIEANFEHELIREIGAENAALAAEVFRADYFVNMLNRVIYSQETPGELLVTNRTRYLLATTLMRAAEGFSEARGIAAVSRMEYDDAFRTDIIETGLSVLKNNLTPDEHRKAEQLLRVIQVRSPRSDPRH